jgi:catechol 2,3-dioxygenase-like lactoylglutathione lyase family enzyme
MNETLPMAPHEPTLQVRTLDHVTLVVKDLQRSRDFYVGVLGMQPLERPRFSFEGSWFQAGKTQIHLILEHAESGPAGIGVPQQLLALSRTHHFAFEVEDTHAAAEYLRRRNIPIVSGPKERPDGFVQVFATDPDGHVVELCSAPKQTRDR